MTPILWKILDILLGYALTWGLDRFLPSLKGAFNSEIITLDNLRQEEKGDQTQQEGSASRTLGTEGQRILDALKQRRLSTERLIERYDRPLNAIVLSYATQKEDVNGSARATKFVMDEGARYNIKSLGGTTAMIPPSSVPASLRNQDDLKRWFEEEILKGRYCKIKFLLLVDLRKKAYWGTYLPYAQIKPNHHSIGEVLGIEDLFTEGQISKISLAEIIREGDIAWLASSVLSGSELDKVVMNQRTIEQTLGDPSLRELANGDKRDELAESLTDLVGDPGSVADTIVEEARFWHSRLRG